MKLSRKIYLIASIIFVLFVGFILTAPDAIFEANKDLPKPNNLWNNIKHNKKVVVLMQNNSTGYFIYRGQTQGIHYEMIKQYCDDRGFDLQIVVEDDLNQAIKKIHNHKADILAVDYTYTKPRSKIVNFTIAHAYTRQVLVQRQKTRKTPKKFATDVLDLEGKVVFVEKGTTYKKQLEYLQEQTGATFKIIEDLNHSTEELVALVASGKIDYTVCDKRVAMVNKSYQRNIDYSLQLSPRQKLCWAVPPSEDSLRDEINIWLSDFRKTKRYKKLERKYFATKRLNYLADNKYIPSKGDGLSPYDDLIKKYSMQINWDWRLLAALIYQESHFKTNVVSAWSGALGLMQLMPETARRVGGRNLLTAEGNIKAGVRYLKSLDNQFNGLLKDNNDKLKFILASYNSGPGHVIDARRLAEKYNLNPDVWDNSVEKYMILKEKPKYYQDAVVKHGYFYGRQSCDFVKEIFERYRNYSNLVSL